MTTGEPSASSTEVSQSQLRRRWEVDVELDIARATRAASATAPPEPGFLEDEPEDGVPTPRPRMPLSSVPVRVVADHELLTLPLDHRAGFVLSHVDGTTDIRTLIDVCGMTHDELVAVVDRLIALRVIRLS